MKSIETFYSYAIERFNMLLMMTKDIDRKLNKKLETFLCYYDSKSNYCVVAFKKLNGYIDDIPKKLRYIMGMIIVIKREFKDIKCASKKDVELINELNEIKTELMQKIKSILAKSEQVKQDLYSMIIQREIDEQDIDNLQN